MNGPGIKRLRSKLGLTQDQFAILTGVAQAIISKGERFGFSEEIYQRLVARLGTQLRSTRRGNRTG